MRCSWWHARGQTQLMRMEKEDSGNSGTHRALQVPLVPEPWLMLGQNVTGPNPSPPALHMTRTWKALLIFTWKT